ncbi:uncharacterized protein LOC132045477 [Lycium ferocissimum]|uniref:uncharacterized protein LOC132045477 n=1 Tax=Lycium ferocissimum TaxID=112874 RepID=UPI002815F76D|nr:uncharacterized protein LOC132045477 [Lycium ferocissimum]
MGVDYDHWIITTRGPLIPIKTIRDGTRSDKTEEEFVVEDFRMMKLNAKEVNILHCTLGRDEYNRVSGCSSAKEIWDLLTQTREVMSQKRQLRLNMPLRKYELFAMS